MLDAETAEGKDRDRIQDRHERDHDRDRDRDRHRRDDKDRDRDVRKERDLVGRETPTNALPPGPDSRGLPLRPETHHMMTLLGKEEELLTMR